ncbi:MAG: AbrB/MazE/SpoVT family DNA-binding domain-containing protein [Clostridia bacterium]|nr:AbrB/MazE/SpoVT family DNA-binding domain-containing protein [Clostridia bacterium]
MKTGIIRRIDDLGRIVIPKETRRMLGIKEGDPLELSLDGNKIVFELYIPTCDYEDSINRIIERIEQDDYLFEKAEYREAREKAISALKEAYAAIHPTEKGGGEE